MINFEPPFAITTPRPNTAIATYTARIEAFIEAGRNTIYTPADSDSQKIAVILVDYQHDFVDPAGTLYVPGSQEDIARFLRWFYMHAHKITSVYASLDTHLPLQIFYNSWWQNPQTGAHPQPYTVITAGDIDNKTWAPILEPEWSIQYVHLLQQKAKKDLMIWPYHTMEGTLGHIEKGRTARTEFYGIFGAEVPDPQSPESALNTTLLDAVMQHDKIYIAGEAKSHCVLETERQLVDHYAHQPAILQKLYFLKDSTSSVQHPTIDFDALAEIELSKMEQQGVHLVLSTDPVE